MTDQIIQIKKKAAEISSMAEHLRIRTERMLADLKAINTPAHRPKKQHHGRVIQRVR